MDTNTVMIGDINMPGIQWEMELSDAKGRDLLETITEEGLEQLVSFPTHVKGNVLDLLITNCPDRIIKVADEGRLGKSDHCILNIEMECCIHQTLQESIKYNWSKADVTKIKEDLEEPQWRERLGECRVEEGWTILTNRLAETIEQNVP
jgi:hypothetical protein